MKLCWLLALTIVSLVIPPISFCQDDTTTAVPVPPYQVRGSVTGPRPVYNPAPGWPKKTRNSGDRAAVLLWVVVGLDGLPHDITVARPADRDFDQAAIDCMKKWKFSPATKDGKPVAVKINVEVNFRIY
jgi:protein TonB